MPGRALGPQLSWVRLSLRILLYQVFYNFHAPESILQLIWRKGLSISDLLAQVEGKNRLRNGTLILQVVKYGDGSREGYVGVVQAQDTIKTYILNPYSTMLRPNGWSVLTRSPVCGKKRVFPLTWYMIHDTWSGARTGLRCIAIRSSEKNWGWALSVVAQRWLDQVGRVIGVPFERGCEFYNICPSE